MKARLTSSRATVLHTTGTDRMLSMEPSTAVKGNLLLPVDQLHVATESSLVASENSQPCDFVLNSTAAAEDIPPVSSNSDTHSSAALSSSGRLPPCEELSPDQIRFVPLLIEVVDCQLLSLVFLSLLLIVCFSFDRVPIKVSPMKCLLVYSWHECPLNVVFIHW